MKNDNHDNNFMYRIISLVCIMTLVSSFALTGCNNISGNADLAAPTAKELAWMDKPTGSAAYLDGHTLLVSIYMDADGSSSSGWSDEDIARTREYLDMSSDYLVAAGKDHGCDVKLTYDTGSYPDLLYYTDMDVIKDGMDDTEAHDITDSWIEENIDYLSLLEKYDADSIGFIYFMNSGGTSWCYPYYPDAECPEYGYLEKAYMYLYDEYGEEYENPATYTHEILHMFGAVDLYTTSKEDGVTKKVIRYVDKTYPRDIMYTVYDENEDHVYNHIPCEIGPITAYFIGFTDYCEELELFPQIKRDNKASYPEY